MEADWRFFRCRNQRQAVHEALSELGYSRRLERYDFCGKKSWVESCKSPSSGKQIFRIRCKRCGDPFCPACSRERMRRVCRNLGSFMQAKRQRFRFVTLTLRQEHRGLVDQINDLQRAFRRLRQSKIWKRSIKNAVWCMEIKLAKSGLWNCHLHLIYCGQWIDQGKLSDAWRAASRGSYIVDVRAADARAPVELTKYMSKSYELGVFKRPERLRELIQATESRKTFGVLGKEWRGLRLSSIWRDPDQIDLPWEYVDTVDHLIDRLKERDRRAAEIIDAIPQLRLYAVWLHRQLHREDTS